jgi:hypothetical protein
MNLKFEISIVCMLILGVGSARSEKINFNQHIRPILSDRCFLCHGQSDHDRKANLRLDQADGPEGAYRTHKGKTAIKPGSLADSQLWHRINSEDKDERMPPPEAHKKRLTAEERARFRQWIEEGAVYESFWAFEPPKNPAAPKVKDASWSDQQIDRFVLQKLESNGLNPSAEADRRTLIRRVTFDLTGLPPTSIEIHSFLTDVRPSAYEELVDRLIAKKQYGEHMTRYWLDLVRFADTNGMHKDFYRNFVAYRDWVIRSFNDNLAYDDFLRYQLAGDLYDEPTRDQFVASGFNRLHLIIDRGTALPEESHVKNVIDRVTAVGTTFLGMTVHCARCHDHKYDPITQKDYYGLFAFFNNIDAQPETSGRPRNGLQPPFIALAKPEQEKQLKAFDEQLNELAREIAQAKKSEGGEKDPNEKKKKVAARKKLEGKRKQVQKQRNAFDRNVPSAMVMKERKDVRPAHFLKRGQYDQPGEVVERNTPSFLPALKKRNELASRMDLADWFADRQHPLTARVAVNRFWQQFFGTGLVKTSEDLGAQGEVPSHPALLDHLAVSFMESDWDVKALIKQMVMSKTYRQASIATPQQFENDPENRLLARASRYRMDAEMIRDQILATSGLLSTTMYGKSVKPPQPDGLWKAVSMTGERFKPDAGEAIYRRSLYTHWKRAMPPPQMTIMNAPNRDACIARRERTNTPLQALLLLNESEYLKAARKLALNVLEINGIDTKKRIAVTWETVTAKLPDDRESALMEKLIKDTKRYYDELPQLASALCGELHMPSAHQNAELAAWTIAVNTLYNLDITKTRE